MKKSLINIIKFRKKVSNIIKKFNRKLTYYKKYLELKKINAKEGFHCICKQVILIDSVHKKMTTIFLKHF